MAELPAELRLDTKVDITLVPMLVRPGDTVVIPLERRMSDAEYARVLVKLNQAMPGVRWTFMEVTPMRHALVYRPDEVVESAQLRRDT